MTDAKLNRPGVAGRTPAQSARLQRRRAFERRFRLLGLASIGLAALMLAVLVASVVSSGFSAFEQTYVRLDLALDKEAIDPEGASDPKVLWGADYGRVIKKSLRAAFPKVRKRRDKRQLYQLVSPNSAFTVRDLVLEDPALVGTSAEIWLKGSDDIDMLAKGLIRRDVEQSDRRVSDKQIAWFDALVADGRVESRFNWDFLFSADSREPEEAGIAGAVIGSLLTLVVTLLLSFPVGVMASLYLEEFAPKNRFTDLIEVNINNLAAVPSIVFGLLGLAMFLNLGGLPRSAPLVGGMVLALMTLPTIIIAGRSALKSVPPSIREAALGLGASKLQVVVDHVLPLAMPGILTGTIIGMARALGETAPLLMIGMVAFIVDIPGGFSDPATVLPVQIFIWADSPERAFAEKTAAAILVLLVFLFIMNAGAVWLRKRFERRW